MAARCVVSKKIVEAIRGLSAKLEEVVEALTEIGLDLAGADRHLVDMVLVDRVAWVAAHLSEEPEDATQSRLEYIIGEGEKVLARANRLERKYLVSQAVAVSMAWRIKSIEPTPDQKVWGAYRRWDGLRMQAAPTPELRQAYLAAAAAIQAAAEKAADARIKRAMAPPPAPARKPKHRRSAEDSALRQRMRGANPQPPKHGGGGNSRDARRRARKRQAA